jgi:hypothetical protein
MVKYRNDNPEIIVDKVCFQEAGAVVRSENDTRPPTTPPPPSTQAVLVYSINEEIPQRIIADEI